MRADSSPDGSSRSGELTAKEHRFIEHAFRAGSDELELGELAKQKAACQAVREFGERMVREHAAANDQLKQVAAKRGIALSSQPASAESATIRRLQTKSGAAFDQAYAREMLRIHTRLMREFQAAAKDLQDPDLLAWALNMLTMLQQHQRLASGMAASFATAR